MTDLSDTELELALSGECHTVEVTVWLAREVKRRREAQRAAVGRAKEVLLEVAFRVMEHPGITARQRYDLADTIATLGAEQLAVAAPALSVGQVHKLILDASRVPLQRHEIDEDFTPERMLGAVAEIAALQLTGVAIPVLSAEEYEALARARDFLDFNVLDATDRFCVDVLDRLLALRGKGQPGKAGPGADRAADQRALDVACYSEVKRERDTALAECDRLRAAVTAVTSALDGQGRHVLSTLLDNESRTTAPEREVLSRLLATGSADQPRFRENVRGVVLRALDRHLVGAAALGAVTRSRISETVADELAGNVAVRCRFA